MSAGLIRLKLEEHRLLDKTKIITCEAGDVIKAGKFTVEFIHVNHSIADAVAFAIKCPVGTCVHTGDFKIDATPIQGGMIDLARLGQLGKEGVLALLADSTNVERPGYTRSERSVGNSFDALFKGCEERIIVTTFASNVDRHPADHRCGRPLWPQGSGHWPQHGERHEGVHRAGLYEHPRWSADGPEPDQVPAQEQGCASSPPAVRGDHVRPVPHGLLHPPAGGYPPRDRIIISASAIPGNEHSIGNVINELYRKGRRWSTSGSWPSTCRATPARRS